MNVSRICLFLMAISTVLMPSGFSQERAGPVVNLMIDVDTPSVPTNEEVRTLEVNLHKMYSEIRARNQTATIFLTQDTTSCRIRLLLAQYGVLSDFEFAISGNHSEDKLSSMSFSEQKALIERSIELAKASKVCGINEIDITGFMPPLFDQNEDTYKVMDDLGIKYDAGFQEGIIYAPGHENDVWPYNVEGYGFYAVPVSTYTVSGKKVPLYDRYIKDDGIGPSKWYDLLVARFEQSAGKDEPLVILLTTSISGSGEYLDALTRFLDYAKSKGAVFVNTMDLVKMSASDSDITPTEAGSECLTCGQEESKNLSITIVKATNSTNSSDQEATA